MSVSFLAASARTEVVELRHVSGRDLQPVLQEETQVWRDLLAWDFSSSAELVERFVDLQSLSGYAMILGREVAGYAYFICEERKGMIGDLYIKNEYRTWERENLLLKAVLDELVKICAVKRVESQLMMLDSPLYRPLVNEDRLQIFPRTFMVREARCSKLEPTNTFDNLLFEPWRDERHDEAAQLIAHAYRGHVDSNINDQYRSTAGSRRFLLNIIQYPGCGRFLPRASYLIFRKDSSHPCGLLLSSLVSATTGHITQVCVNADSRGMGIGYEMMRRAVSDLEALGCERISLTVTAENTSAIRLYERMGFRRTREFAAHVWDGF